MAASFSIERGNAVLANGGTVSFLRAGAGPQLVLLHGIGSNASSWRAQLQELAASFDVIAWNAPGYAGSSPLAPEAPDAGDYATALSGFLDAIGIERCHVAGHSLGSLIAVRFARENSERVTTLTLASCALGHARLAPAERERLLAGRLDDVRLLGMRGMAEKRGPRLLTGHASAAMRTAVTDAMGSADPRGYAQAARMLSAGDMLADIGGLAPDMPVQFVYGLQDVITPPDANETAAKARPGAKVVRIANAGHAVYIEQADAFNDAIRTFAGTADGA
ncbi:MAG: alpha/beta fold hydrolase [Beijerinckiaceae bacterium]